MFFLTTIPKSGTHLVLRVMELTGVSRDTRVNLNFGHIARSTAGLDEDGRRRFVNNLYAVMLDVPRRSCIAAHHLWSPEADAFLRAHGIPVITIDRDPRDVAISAAEWFLDPRAGYPNRGQLATLSAAERIKLQFVGDGPTLPFLYENMARWNSYPWRLHLSFERLVGPSGGGSERDQIDEIGRLARFLGVHVSSADIARRTWGESHTFRAGKIGGWRERSADFRGIGDEIRRCLAARDAMAGIPTYT